VAPASLLHPRVPQPDGTVLYELLTGHPDRAAHKLVFLPDLTVELCAWPTDTWARLDVDPQAAGSGSSLPGAASRACSSAVSPPRRLWRWSGRL
jgi:hypothetical protein